MALVVLGVVSAVGGAAVLLVTLDVRLAAADRHREQVSAAAMAALEAGMAGLAAEPDWDAVLGGAVRLGGSSPDPTLVVGPVTVDLATLTREQQEATDRQPRGGPDVLRWRAYGWGAFDALVPLAAPPPVVGLVVWVSDDEQDGDGDATHDVNRRLVVYGAAYGSRGTRAAWSAVVARQPHGVALVSWRLPADRDPDP